MEKTMSALQNTGLKREETFIFRFCSPKSKLLDQFEEHSRCSFNTFYVDSISFNHGLLAGISNTFRLYFSEISLPGVRLEISPELANSDLFATKITGVNLSLQENGRVCHYEYMQLEERRVYTSSVRYEMNKFYKCQDTSDVREWPDSATELRFDIIVSQLARLEYKISEDISNSLPNMDFKTRCIDVSNLFLSTQFSDASIECEGEIFPVHLFVLAECSPVFGKMFEHNTKEAETKTVEIRDSQPDVIREMLRYFYTQAIDCLDVNGFHLYELSDKYLVADLKTLCATVLIGNMNLENVTEVYCFGRKHEDQVLTKAAENFLCKHKEELIKNYRELQAFLNDIHPTFADDIFQLLWKN